MSNPKRVQVYPAWVSTDSEKKLHDSFPHFCWLIWRHLKLPSPTRLQRSIMRYLQTGDPRRMIQAFRGAAKSYITCAYALWRLYRDPQERVKIISANEDKATENAVFIRRLIEEVEQLQFLRPKDDGRDSVLKFDVGPAEAAPTASVSALGITGQMTGGRATILIADDIEVPKNSYTEAMRERLAKLVTEFEMLVIPEGFDIIYLGTPQTEQSVYNVVRTRGYDCRIWPVRYVSVQDNEKKYGGAISPELLRDLEGNPKLLGTSTEPERFTDLHLANVEVGTGGSGGGRSEFMLHFMLDTTLADAERYPLKMSDIIVMDIDATEAPVKLSWTSDPRNALEDIPNVGFSGDRLHRPLYISTERAKYQGAVMVIDPSGRGGDETAFAVVKSLMGLLHCPAVGGHRGGYSADTLQALAATAKLHQVKEVLIESNFGDGMFNTLIAPYFSRIDPTTGKPFYPVTITEYRASGQKERRIIEDLEPVLNQHRLVLDVKVCRADVQAAEQALQYSLLYQLSHLTKDRQSLRHDDRVEVLARGCRYFLTALANDNAKAEEDHKVKLREKDFDDFMKLAGKNGWRPPGKQWCSTKPSVLKRR